MEASGGDHVRFAAPGADMIAASVGGKYTTVRGTSYASPLVAGLIATLRARDDSAGVDDVTRLLAAIGAENTSRGRSRRYSYLVGTELRTDPTRFAGRAAN